MNERQPHEQSRPDAFPIVDASDGDFYSLGQDFVGCFAVKSKTDENTGHPFSTKDDVARFDPRHLRLHDLKKKTPGGAPDRRMSIQSYNDRDGEYTDPDEGAAPLQQAEAFSALNRSTREVDGAGRVALPSSQRWVVDSEDGKHVIATKFGELPMGDPVEAPELPDAQDDAGGGLPPGVSFSREGTDPSVSIGGSGGAVTFRGQAATAAARDAAARGGTAGDVARAASAAARGLPPPPDSTWEGTPGGTRTRDPDGAGSTRARDPQGGVAPSARPEGYVTDGDKHGLWNTLITLDQNDRPGKSYFRGGEGTPIGRVALRHDAHVSMGQGLSGAIRFVSDDASAIPRGRKLFKGELWADRSLANQDSEVGLEDLKWSVVVGVDADLPPSADPPPMLLVDPGKKPPKKKPPPPGPLGGGRGPETGDPAGGTGGDGSGGGGADPGGIRGGGDPPGVPVIGGNDKPLPPVANPEAQGRDFSGPGSPCPNLTAGREVIDKSGVDEGFGGTTARPAPIPGTTRTRTGGLLDNVGYPGLTPVGGGRLAIGGSAPSATVNKRGIDDGFGIPGGAGGAPTGPIDDTGFEGGIGLGLPGRGGRSGGGGGAPGGVDVVDGARAEAEERAAAEAAKKARDAAREARDAAEQERIDGLRQDEANAKAEADKHDAGGRRASASGARGRESRARRARERAERRQRERRDRRDRRDRYKRERDQRREERRQRARDQREEQLERERRRRRAREARRGRGGRGQGTIPDGAWVIDVTDPGAPVLGGGGFQTAEEQEKAADDASRHGDWNVANAPLPLFGAPGGASSLEQHVHLMTVAHNAQTELLTGYFGGPGFYSGNVGQREKNRPGVPVVGSDYGQHATAYSGETTTVRGYPALFTGILEAEEGAAILATGGVLGITREARGPGSVTDGRALVELINRGGTGQLLSTPEGRVSIGGAKDGWTAFLGGAQIIGYPDDEGRGTRRGGLFSVGMGTGSPPPQVPPPGPGGKKPPGAPPDGTQPPAPVDEVVIVDAGTGHILSTRGVDVEPSSSGEPSDVTVDGGGDVAIGDGGATTYYPPGTSIADGYGGAGGTTIYGYPGGVIIEETDGDGTEMVIGGNITAINETDPNGSKLTVDVVDPYLIIMDQKAARPTQLDATNRGFWVGTDDVAYYWDGTVDIPWGGSGGSIATLTDVDLTGIVDGDILVYDLASTTWNAVTPGDGLTEYSAYPSWSRIHGTFDSETAVAWGAFGVALPGGDYTDFDFGHESDGSRQTSFLAIDFGADTGNPSLDFSTGVPEDFASWDTDGLAVKTKLTGITGSGGTYRVTLTAYNPSTGATSTATRDRSSDDATYVETTITPPGTWQGNDLLRFSVAISVITPGEGTSPVFKVGRIRTSWIGTGVGGGGGGGGSPHALLDGTQNNDTLAAAPVRGSVIVANSTPAWAAKAIGTSGKYFRSDGTDADWATILDADIPATIARDAEVAAAYQPLDAQLTTLAGLASVARLEDVAAVTPTNDSLLAGNGSNLVMQTITSLIDEAIGSTRGAILYRGEAGWAIRDPGTTGYVVTSNGAGADPTYEPAPGAGTGPIFDDDGASQFQMRGLTDGTKRGTFELDTNVPTSTTVDVAWPAANGTMLTSANIGASGGANKIQAQDDDLDTIAAMNAAKGEMLIGATGGNAWTKIGSDWESKTITGSWVSNTTYYCEVKRQGDSLWLRVYIITTGTPTSATLTLTLPDSLSIDTADFPNDHTSFPVGDGLAYDASAAVFRRVGVLIDSTTTIKVYAENASSNLIAVTQASPWAWVNGDALLFTAGPIPISGW